MKLNPLLFTACCAAMCGALFGCGDAATTPDQAVSKFYAALGRKDFSGAWALISEQQRQKVTSGLEAVAALPADQRSAAFARLAAQFGANPQDVSGTSDAGEFFVAAMDAALKRDKGRLAALIASPRVKPGAIDAAGEHADVAVEFVTDLRGKDGKSIGERTVDQRIVRCVRDGGGWRLLYTP